MTEISKAYGGALYDLVSENVGLVKDIVLEELAGVRDIFAEHPDYLKLLATPGIPKKEREEILDETFAGRIHPYLLNFLKLLCINGYLGELPSCEKEYRRRYNEARGISIASVTSASPLTEEQEQRLSESLSDATGRTVLLECRVDPSLLAGIRLELDGKQLDGSVKHRLDAIRARLSGLIA